MRPLRMKAQDSRLAASREEEIGFEEVPSSVEAGVVGKIKFGHSLFLVTGTPRLRAELPSHSNEDRSCSSVKRSSSFCDGGRLPRRYPSRIRSQVPFSVLFGATSASLNLSKWDWDGGAASR